MRIRYGLGIHIDEDKMRQAHKVIMAVEEWCELSKLALSRGSLLQCGVVLFFSVFLFTIAGVQGAIVEIEDEGLHTSLDAARETWLQNVSFYGTYTFKRTGFYSEEEAHTKSVEDKYIVAKGFICKLKDKYRLQVIYVKEPKVEGSSGSVSGRSIDTVANKNFHAHFYPEQGTGFVASGSLNKRATYTIANIVPHLQAINTPFSFFLTPIVEISSSVSLEPQYGLTYLNDAGILLSFTGKDTGGNKYVREIIIRTNERIPVIEQITLHIFGNGGNTEPLSSSTRKVLEWKICDGISVPSHIRTVSGPLKPANIDADTWIVSEWQSDDLGKRPPTDKDFVLQLPPNVGLVGMNHYPKGGLVDIDAITDADFLESGSLYQEQELWGSVEPEQSRYLLLRWSLMLLGAILILWGFTQRYRKRKNSE